MQKNLKDRKISKKNWPGFEQREGFLVSKFSNIFDILSDISHNKDQMILDDLRGGQGEDQLMYKNVSEENVVEKASEENLAENISENNLVEKASEENEENKEIDNSQSNYRPVNKETKRIYDEIQKNVKKRKKILNEINQENLEHWTNIMYGAVRDLTSLTKGERNSRLNLEDLYQALKTVLRINEKVDIPGSKSKIEYEDDMFVNGFTRPTLSDIKDKKENEGEDKFKTDYTEDFYVCVTEERVKKQISYNLGLW